MLFTSVVAIAASILFRESILTKSATNDIVDVGYAKYLGNRTFPNTVAYLGIPYAEPPLGDRRFRAPLPLDTARISRTSGGEVIDARQNPDFCIQGTTGGGFWLYIVHTLSYIYWLSR